MHFRSKTAIQITLPRQCLKSQQRPWWPKIQPKSKVDGNFINLYGRNCEANCAVKKDKWRYKILIGNLLVFFRHWVIATDQGVWWWSCFRGLESRSQIKYLRYIRVSRDSRHDNDARWRYFINLYVFNVAYIGGLDLDVQSLPTILKNRVLLKNEQDVRKRAERATDTLLLFKQLHAIT